MKSLAIFALSTLAAASAFALTQTPNGAITISKRDSGHCGESQDCELFHDEFLQRY